MILIVIILIVVGVSIKYGKQYFLIAGYNTMSATKKAKYDIKRIADLMGNVLIAMALIILIGYFIAQWLGDPTIEMLSVNIAVFLGVPYLLIMANSRKYKLNLEK